ncbi:MAG: TetR family transcriptional regulator [Nitriliruptoraceae bacterium]
MVRTGRRPGGADTQSEILAAAREQFAAKGYSGSTIRGIAAAAGVDPALIHHYFGTKRALFVTAVQLPFHPDEVLAAGVEGDPQQAGERIVRMLLGIWSTEEGRAATQSLLRSALTDDDLLKMLREFMIDSVVTPLVAAAASDHHRLRAGFVASQVIGLAFVRHIAQVEPLASSDHDTVVRVVAPTLQRYLTGDIGVS